MTNVYGVAPGIDFPRALVRGLEDRFGGQPPENWARITLVLNTRRMARRVRAIFDQGPARLLPRIILLNEVDALLDTPPPPPPVSSLQRRLELARLIAPTLEGPNPLGPRAALFDLADSLAALIDEMQGEGIGPEAILELDVSNHSQHFARTKDFLEIVRTYLSASHGQADVEERQRRIVLDLQCQWERSPPSGPVILAGSTASRGTTRILAESIAQLDRGAVILPGFDQDMARHVWDRLSDGPLPAEDHPQYRFLDLCRQLNLHPVDVPAWTTDAPHSAERNALVSLALRPAPVTDAWREEGPALASLAKATKDITLVEAESPRAEATAVAARLRAAAETGQTAALITPDRMLTRQVAAALGRWNIVPDDSAGQPLHLSPPGRFLRHVAETLGAPLDSEKLIVLLKHPLCHSGVDQGPHHLHTQRLELELRKLGIPFPDAENLSKIGQKLAGKHGPEILDWIEWIVENLCPAEGFSGTTLADYVAAQLSIAEALAAGPAGDPAALWDKEAGRKARGVMEALGAQGDTAMPLSRADYISLLTRMLMQDTVRDRDAPFPGIMIWGTLEARVQGADLVILAGLNDGTWPENPDPDPWLNRALRYQAGLLLPDRRIGLAAHDFQQAIAAKEVWLTRALRNSEAETVPSRWLNRLINLLDGLPDTGGKEALGAMRQRGNDWMARAEAIERPFPQPKATRPQPRPPADARPRKYSVSDIVRLIRDPYAVYAKRTLDLYPLNPLVADADARLRGTILHEVLEGFVSQTANDPTMLTTGELSNLASEILQSTVPWPSARALWLARIGRVAQWFVDGEHVRQANARPEFFEMSGRMILDGLGVEITAKADRMDSAAAGQIVVYDYKTSTVPSTKQQEEFDRQLLIEAAMIEAGAFENMGPRTVMAAQYIGLGANPKVQDAPIASETPQKTLDELRDLVRSYQLSSQGFTARRAMHKSDDVGDYDQLARYGEWEETDDPIPEDLE